MMRSPRASTSYVPAPAFDALRDVFSLQGDKTMKLPKCYEIHETAVYLKRVIRRVECSGESERMALLLREGEVFSLLTMPDAIMVFEQAFSARAQGNAVNRPRTRIVQANGVMHMLAAAVPTLGAVGFKTYTVFRSGLRSVVMLFSAQDGHLMAVIEADWLGRMRTGATSGLATKY